MIKETERWYSEHVAMVPLQKLQHAAQTPEALKEVRWQRLERRASTMILQCVPEGVREDIVANRKLSVFSTLAHLLQTYCPGGVMERQTLLRNLEEPAEVTSMSEAPAALRRWMRWRERTVEIGAVAPDPSLLLKGLNKLMEKMMEGNRDLQFRIALVRSSLMVDTTPTEVNVEQLARHMLAEVEQLALMDKKPVSNPSKNDSPKLKNFEAEKGKGKGKERSEGEERPKRKFYMSDQGCRKGRECGFSHDQKDDKRRCYVRGSVDHLAPACTRPKRTKEGKEMSPKAKTARAEKEESSPGGVKKQESEVKEDGGSSVKDLLQEANRMLRSLTGGTPSSASTSSTKDTEERKDMVEKLQEQLNAMKTFKINRMKPNGTMGLLDSGATHCLRPPRSGEPLENYPDVKVELASGQHVRLKMRH